LEHFEIKEGEVVKLCVCVGGWASNLIMECLLPDQMQFLFFEKDVLEHVIGLMRGSSFLVLEIVCLSNTFEILNKADTKILFICLLI